MGMCSSSQSVSKDSIQQYKSRSSRNIREDSVSNTKAGYSKETLISSFVEKNFKKTKGTKYLEDIEKVPKENDLPAPGNHRSNKNVGHIGILRHNGEYNQITNNGVHCSTQKSDPSIKDKVTEKTLASKMQLDPAFVEFSNNFSPQLDKNEISSENMIPPKAPILKIEMNSNASGSKLNLEELENENLINGMKKTANLTSKCKLDKEIDFYFIENSGIKRKVPLLSSNLFRSSIVARRKAESKRIPDNEQERRSLPVFSVRPSKF